MHAFWRFSRILLPNKNMLQHVEQIWFDVTFRSVKFVLSYISDHIFRKTKNELNTRVLHFLWLSAYTYIHTYIYTHTHTYTHIYTHIKHTHTHTCKHTHVHSSWNSNNFVSATKCCCKFIFQRQYNDNFKAKMNATECFLGFFYKKRFIDLPWLNYHLLCQRMTSQ